MSAYRKRLTTMMYLSTLGFVMTNVISDKTSNFKSRKSRSLLCNEPRYDYDAIKKFKLDDIFSFSRKTDKTIQMCHDITVVSHGRLNQWSDPYVYDAMATDIQTNIRAVIRTCTEQDDAMRWAQEGLISKLYSDGFIEECSLTNFSSHMVSTECNSGAKINCSTSCSFYCDTHGYNLIGRSIITCKKGGTLSADQPTCEAQKGRSSTSPSHDIHPTRETRKEVPSTTQTTAMKKHHGVPVTSEATFTLASSTSIKRETEGRKHAANWYLAFLAIPTIVILVAMSYLVSVLKKRCRFKQYNYLDDSSEIRGEGEGCPYVTEEEEICPDVDGYYRNLKVLQAEPTETQLDPDENYNMTSREKGLVFILNNNDFANGTLRIGSEIDVENVEHVFQEIGYRSVLCRDLTGNEIRNALTSLVEKIESSHASVVLVLMSHGEKEGILGVDGKLVTMEEIKVRFSGRNCPALLSKPKIIFVQACRGTTMTKCATNTGFLKSEGVGIMTTDSLFRCTTATDDLSPEEQIGMIGVETDCNVPDNADMFIAHATSEGYFSMRDRVNGSWFIQALCEELLASAHRDDLDTIMTKVTRRVKNREAKIKVQGRQHRAMQTPQTIKQGIGKQIYFLPKYPPTDSELL